jgi:hypothetical protein
MTFERMWLMPGPECWLHPAAEVCGSSIAGDGLFHPPFGFKPERAAIWRREKRRKETERTGPLARVSDMETDAAAGPVVAGASADSFESFYAATADRVYRALAVTLGDSHLAREATDEAMARAFVRWRQVATAENPGGWVFRVGLNWATSSRQRLQRRLFRTLAGQPARRRPGDLPHREHLDAARAGPRRAHRAGAEGSPDAGPRGRH